MSLRGDFSLQTGSVKDYLLPPNLSWLAAPEVVKRRSVRSNADPLNRRSWPMVPGSIKQQQKDKERQDQLTEILNRYSLGLPPFPELLAPERLKFDDSIFELEPSWKVIVDNHEGLSKKQHEHQEAVWELLHTEVSYIKQIRVIIDVFQNCLMNVQLESFLNEIDAERLFSNIDKVYECNCLFWQHHLLPVLQHSRDSKQPLDPLIAKEGFLEHFPILFQVYFKYFIEHKSCLEYAKTCTDNSDLFRIFVQWAETQKQCNRLRFADILGQPMPRLLKYSLLLHAILKYTECEKDRTDLQAMIRSVDRLCTAADSNLRRREEYERLEAVRKTIEPLDAVEAPNDECAKIVQEYSGSFNLLAPMPGLVDDTRSLLFQSSLRMKEGQNVKMDVDCLLFTDLLLICKSNKRMERFKIIRPPMRLDQLVINELKDRGSFLLIYMNEYNVPISAFTFHSDSGAIRGWLEKFREAQREFKARNTQKKSEINRLRSDTTLTQGELDEISLSSGTSYLDVLASAIPRSESADSLDHFIPNILTANYRSSDTSQPELARSTSSHSGNFHNYASSLTSHTDITNAYTDSRLPIPSTPDDSHSCTESSDSHGTKFGSKHKLIQTSQSVPNVSAGSSTNDSPKVVDSPPKQMIIIPDNSRGFQETVVEKPKGQPLSQSFSKELRNINLSSSEKTVSEQNSISNDEDLTKIKLSSRRTEKRYRTADEIPDIQNSKKDTSIHKWSSLRTDVEISDPKTLGSSVLSTDSLQSCPSSSGVSSTGSLHLATEVNEEHDDNRSIVFIGNDLTRTDHRKHFSIDNTGDLSDINDVVDAGGNKLRLSESKHSKSKSTSDLVEAFSNTLQVNQMTDGIASVAVPTDGFHRKLTHMDIVRLKKIKHQILFDVNIESSEV